MKRFFALFSIPASVVDEWKKNTPPERMKAAAEEMMGAWKKWMTDHEKDHIASEASVCLAARGSATRAMFPECRRMALRSEWFGHLRDGHLCGRGPRRPVGQDLALLAFI